jgi:tetratricopeptide (TPR) repeat protein
MKKFLILLLALMPFVGVAQEPEQPQSRQDTPSKEDEELINYFAGLSQEQREELLESSIVFVVDSLLEEGMYMQAMEGLDNVVVGWKKTGKPAPPMIYLKRLQINRYMEEWQQVINDADSCIASINYYQDPKYRSMAALVYKSQGDGYRYIEDYKNAIRPYENAVGLYKELGVLIDQADALCSIANCYDLLDKTNTAAKFYENGLSKYLQAFGISEKRLLQQDLVSADESKQNDINVFGLHLLRMAILEEKRGNNMKSKDYLLMSAHCGLDVSRSEYQRLYGN